MTSLSSTSQNTTRGNASRKSNTLSVGSHIRAKSGVSSPDFPDIAFSGWTGKVVEVSGKKSPFKYFIEWDDAVVAAMPTSYVTRCEEQQIYHRWACLSDSDIEAA